MSNIHDLDLNQLSILALLCETNSVTQTAERAGVTQSAISHSLNKLRKQFDNPLFVKTAGGMEPTPRAKQLYQSIQEPLLQLQQAINPEIRFNPECSQRTFIFGVSDYIEATLLPKLTSHLQRQAPNTTIRCVRINDNNLAETARDVDLIFGHFSNPPENFHEKTLWTEGFLVIAATKHPRIIANRIGLNQYLKEKHILISPLGVGTSIVDRILCEKSLTREIKICTRYFTSPARIVAETDLIATVPRKIAELAQNNYPVKCLKPPIEIPVFDLSMLWGPIIHHDPAHQWLRQQILEITKL